MLPPSTPNSVRSPYWTDIAKFVRSSFVAENTEEMLIANAYTQSDYNLDVLELLQQNGAKIPHEILDKMYEIVRKSGAICEGCDSCQSVEVNHPC